jgi:integrase
MARIIKRVWTSRGPTGHKIKRVAYGYTFQADGKQQRHVSAEWDRETAQAELGKALLKRDADYAAATAPPAPKTLAEVGEEYLAYKRGKGKRSIRQDEQILAKLKARIGAATPVREIIAQRVAQYERDRITETSKLGRLVTPSTVNRELAILRHLLRLAEEWGYIDKVPKIRLAREPEGRLRFLSEEEIPKLLDACAARAGKSPVLLPVVTLALHTGMRKGEILGLEWERVDFSRGVLRLELTKSGRRREVPMNRAVYDALTALPGPKAEGLVFTKRGGAAWGNIRTAFEGACREAKIEGFRFHDLRHTCASWLVMRGRSLKEVQEILGHREFAMTLRYAHLSPDRLRDAVASLESFSTRSAHDAKIDVDRRVSPDAPVAQVDRAAVS